MFHKEGQEDNLTEGNGENEVAVALRSPARMEQGQYQAVNSILLFQVIGSAAHN